MSLFRSAILASTLLGSAQLVAADEVFNDDVIVTGNLCVGFRCGDGQVFASEEIMLLDATPSILFADSIIDGEPNNRWRLKGNSTTPGGDNYFRIIDEDTGRTSLHIDAGLPDNTLYLGPFGNIGLKTSLPSTDLHVFDSLESELRLETTKDSDWAVGAVQSGFYIQDEFNNNRVMRILNGAPDGAMTIVNNGYVGFGTQGPDAPLEVSSDAAFTFLRLTAEDAAVNDSVDITFTGGPLGTGQLRYNIVDGDNQEMSLDADGNMVIDGTLTTAGPTCASGCDRVFDADYALPSIADHAAQMYMAGYLPSIGATVPHAPVNLSERQGNIINALEHAHIYIDTLHRKLGDETRRNDTQAATIQTLLARVDQLEVLLEPQQADQ